MARVAHGRVAIRHLHPQNAYGSHRVAYQVFSFDRSIFAAPTANCQPGGRTRAATRMAGLSGAHVSEGNAESWNAIRTRLHIAEWTEQPPERKDASWS